MKTHFDLVQYFLTMNIRFNAFCERTIWAILQELPFLKKSDNGPVLITCWIIFVIFSKNSKNYLEILSRLSSGDFCFLKEKIELAKIRCLQACYNRHSNMDKIHTGWVTCRKSCFIWLIIYESWHFQNQVKIRITN